MLLGEEFYNLIEALDLDIISEPLRPICNWECPNTPCTNNYCQNEGCTNSPCTNPGCINN
jgi:hypothetical protein